MELGRISSCSAPARPPPAWGCVHLRVGRDQGQLHAVQVSWAGRAQSQLLHWQKELWRELEASWPLFSHHSAWEPDLCLRPWSWPGLAAPWILAGMATTPTCLLLGPGLPVPCRTATLIHPGSKGWQCLFYLQTPCTSGSCGAQDLHKYTMHNVDVLQIC